MLAPCLLWLLRGPAHTLRILQKVQLGGRLQQPAMSLQHRLCGVVCHHLTAEHSVVLNYCNCLLVGGLVMGGVIYAAGQAGEHQQ